MPELPEVEAVVRKLRPQVQGRRITAFGQFRQTTARDAQLAIGKTIDDVSRRGKHILIRLSGGLIMRVHLKMTGNLTVIPDARLRPATVRAWFDFEDGSAMVLDDPRALGRVSLHPIAALDEMFAALGPEPLTPAFTLAGFADAAARSRKPSKLFLMDQQAVTGLGNIYAAEALFLAGIHPKRQARRIARHRLESLHTAIVDVLRVALDSAIRAYSAPGGFTEGENFPVAVYGREGESCSRCGRLIKRIPQAGRSTYFCPGCQR